jgi:hypothetical protein
MSNMLEANWRMHVQGMNFAANSFAYGLFPELAERAKREADEFSKLPPPKGPSEMALLVAQSSLMQASWSNEFLSRAATRANAEILAVTQKAIDALLHR